MRRIILGLMAASIFAGPQVQAQQLQCLTPDERSTIELAALRSQLMVLAMGCRDDDRYNAFVRKYQADLMGNERAVGEMFKRKYGKRAQQEHDRFVTELANGESSVGMHLGMDFCPRNGMIFSEVMSLRSPTELAAYAAGKDLVPPTMEVCTEVAMAPTSTKKSSAPVKHR